MSALSTGGGPAPRCRPGNPAIAVLLFLIAFTAGAQPEGPQITVCLILPDLQSREGQTIRLIVDGELTRQLKQAGFPVVPEAAWRAALGSRQSAPADPAQAAAALGLAVEVEARVAITGTIRIEGPEILLALKAYDATAGTAIFDVEERASRDIGIYNQAASLAGKVVSGLAAWLPPPGEASASAPMTASAAAEPIAGAAPAGPIGAAPATATAAGEPGLIRVTLRSPDEEAEIWLAGEQRVGMISGGRLVLEAPPHSTLHVEKRKPGYRPDREEIPLGEGPTEVALRPLRKAARYALELFYSSSQFLGLGAGLRLYLVPDAVMLKADHYSYFSTASGSAAGPGAYHGDFRLSAGSYLFSRRGSTWRFGVGGGLGLILSVVGASESEPDPQAYQDLYLDLLDVWLELERGRWAVFLRAETKYALGVGNCLLPRGLLNGYGPQYTLGWLYTW